MSTQFRTWLIVCSAIISLMAISTGVEAAKPDYADPGEVLLTGAVEADDGLDGAVETYNVVVRSTNEITAEIVVRHFLFDAVFAKLEDFFSDKYGDPDGQYCFGDPDWASGKYTLFDDEDRSVEFSTFPEFFTVDGEEIQKYHFYLTGYHDVDMPLENNFPADGPATITMVFDRVEITTEGKGQNRRRTCTGVFELDVDSLAIGIFSR